MAHLDRTMTYIADNGPSSTVIPAWRVEQKRQERNHRVRVASSTIIASGLTEERDGERAEI